MLGLRSEKYRFYYYSRNHFRNNVTYITAVPQSYRKTDGRTDRQTDNVTIPRSV